MIEAPALAEKIFNMLDESARTSTYKSALLLALMDRAQEHLDDGEVPVRELAERVIELYWPQTRPYPAARCAAAEPGRPGQDRADHRGIPDANQQRLAFAAGNAPTRRRLGTGPDIRGANTGRVANPAPATSARAIPL